MSKRPQKKPTAEGDEKQEASEGNIICDENERRTKMESFTPGSNVTFSEDLLSRLLSCEGISKCVKEMDMVRIAYIAQTQFAVQGRMLEINGPVTICGDLHGQYQDLIRLFRQVGFPPDVNYLFLGDYVDRGIHNLETILLCLCFKTRYPNNFFMLRGNHEMRHVNYKYGFHEEIFSRVGQNCEIVYEQFISMMEYMPLTALIGGRILCMHGGISPRIVNMDTFRNFTAPFNSEDDCCENDVLWSDPAKVRGWPQNPRGASYLFGEDEVKQVCSQLNIDLIVRGHQVVQDGYELFADNHLVTIFSAPHYMGSFTNSAAVCKVSENLVVSFEVLKPEDLTKAQLKNEKPECMSAEPVSLSKEQAGP